LNDEGKHEKRQLSGESRRMKERRLRHSIFSVRYWIFCVVCLGQKTRIERLAGRP
jgi:hypothetical protein